MQALIAALTATAESFREPFTDGRLDIYLTALQPYPEDLVIEALENCVRERRWFPKVAEIAQEIESIRARMRYEVPQLPSSPELTDQERDQVAAHISEFKQRMGWA